MTAAAKHTVFVLALVLVLVVTSMADARSAGNRDRVAPTAPQNLHVVSATARLVDIAWDPSQDESGIAGYAVYSDSGRAYVATPAYTLGNQFKIGQKFTIEYDFNFYDEDLDRTSIISNEWRKAHARDFS